MYDPLTQAFVIPFPWYSTHSLGNSSYRYWHPFITIWHKDPERKGNDDSCGWFTPPFTETQRDIVKTLAGDEARDPWYFSLSAKTNPNPVECESYIRGAFLLVSRCFENRAGLREPVTLEEATKWASLMVHNSVDNFRNSLCFLSGYHSNWYKEGIPNSPEDDKFWREEQAKSFFGAIAGYILKERRPWYKKPKWHFWHWQLQIHPLQAFKRWAFSRCSKCGKGFKWGESPCSNSWNGGGPQWFKSEDVYHMNCSGSSLPQQEAQVQSGMDAPDD